MSKVMHDSTGGSSVYYGNGVFIDKCTITSIEDKSNYPTRKDLPKKTIGQNAFEPELCLIVNLEDGRKFTIFGQFDYNTDRVSGKQVYKGWRNSGNAVQSFLARMSGGKFEVGNDDTILEKTLNNLIGKEFYKLRYCVGSYETADGEKPSFKDYRKVRPVDDGNDKELYAEFLKGVSYLKGYDPNYFEKWRDSSDQDTKFNTNDFEDDSPI